MIFCARATRGRGRPSPGLMVRLDVPVGGRVRKSRAVEDQSAPFPEDNERARRDHYMDGGRSTCAVGDNPDHLLKTVEGNKKSGTATAANGRASPRPPGARPALRLHAFTTNLHESCGLSEPQDNLAPRQPSAQASRRKSSTDNVSALRVGAISNRCNVSARG